jgi:threonine synthase
MNFHSVLGKSPPVQFREALFHGLAPDGGLYVPASLPHLPQQLFDPSSHQSLYSFGEAVMESFIDEIREADRAALVRRAWTFPIPLSELENNLFLLELFHGPTHAFKDVGARFMAQTLSYFLQKEQRRITLLVATSGDTGSAVAHGFFQVPNIDVVVLYPSGKISKLQEQQMATLGGNIHALEVEGTFDDCQRLVKQALADRDLVAARNLTTANSINVGRLIPQIVYYLWGVYQLRSDFKVQESPLIVVPSGNFGNLTAAVYAKYMGAPVGGLIAATNENDVVPEYLASGVFTPRASVQTYSNAMDVGNPSNLARLQKLFDGNVERMRREMEAVSITDEETLEEIHVTYRRTGKILDPHTAVGVRSARRMGENGRRAPFIIAATAHPGKFPEVVEKALGQPMTVPPTLLELLNKPKLSIRIRAEFGEIKSFLS